MSSTNALKSEGELRCSGMVRSGDLNFTTSNPWLSNFLFSSNPYQSNNDRNYKVWNIVYILWDVYSLCRCYWNVVQYKWKVHNGKADIDLIWLKFSFSMDSHCQFKICFILIKIQFGENSCYLYERSNKWNMKRRYLI